MNRTSKNRSTTCIAFPHDIADGLDKYCYLKRRTRSSIVVEAIEEFLINRKAFPKRSDPARD
jgi:hypothetical protein